MVTLVNRAKVATATTGTGAITLGPAESGYQTFADAGLTGSDTIRYTIEDGDDWEIGTGGINGAVTTMSRTLIESSTGSKLSLSGDAVVYVTAAGQDIVQPSDLATVATTGAYSDLSGLPTLGTAAATDATAYATAAQGSLADSAVQPNDSPSFGSVTVTGTVDGRDVATDGSKLDGIEAGATADQTAGEIKTAYESNANTNAYTDAEKSKLAGIEAGANVTDTANVTAAGALMDSEVTNLAQVKAFDSADYATAAQGSLADSALQSGDNVSALTNDAGYTTNLGDITGVTAGSGITGGGTSGTVTVSHADTSAQSSVNNSGATVIQDVTLDTYGHVTALGSKTLTAADVGAITGNQTITLSGDVSGSGTTSISVTVADDSHNHIIANVDGLQTALDGKLSTSGKAADSNLLDGLDSTAFYLASNPSGYTSNVGDITGVTAGSGISGGGTSGTVTISHADTSSQGSVNNSGTTVIQDITLDTYGHITALGSTTLSIPAAYTNSDVDTHLNTGTAATGEYLSWNGSDYDWATAPAGYTNSDVDTHLNTGTATTDQVLSWNGTDYDWVDGGGAPPTDLYAVGTYIVANTSASVALGGTRAGSGLRINSSYSVSRFVNYSFTGTTPPGTWRNVGGNVVVTTGKSSSYGISLWIRIS